MEIKCIFSEVAYVVNLANSYESVALLRIQISTSDKPVCVQFIYFINNDVCNNYFDTDKKNAKLIKEIGKRSGGKRTKNVPSTRMLKKEADTEGNENRDGAE